MKAVQIRLTEQEHKELKRYVVEHDTSVQALVVMLLRESQALPPDINQPYPMPMT